MATWSLNKEKTGSIKDSNFAKLPVGKNIFLIKSFGLGKDKQDPSGRRDLVLCTFVKDDKEYQSQFHTDAENETQAKIASQCVIGICDACGVHKYDAAGLKKCVGKFVTLTVEETEGKKGTKNEGKTYSNIRDVDPAEEDEDGDEQEGEEEEGEEQEEEAEAEAPAKTKKATPWGK